VRIIATSFGVILLTGCFQSDDKIAAVPQAQQENPAVTDAERLTDLVVRAFPMGDLFQKDLDKWPTWPLENSVAKSKVDATQLHCMRQRMSAAGFREYRRKAVEEFIRQYPDQVRDAIDVLAQGAADAMAFSFQTGMENDDASDGEILFKVITHGMQKLTMEQVKKFDDLTSQKKYKALREMLLFGHGDFFSDDAESGEAFGKMVVGTLMLEAMSDCKIPTSVLESD
jgi:hypothetical protein